MKSALAKRPSIIEIVCKIALITPDRKFLVVRRSGTTTYRPLMWDLPGGRWNGEAGLLDQTMHREIDEELGTMIKNDFRIQLARSVVIKNECTLAIGYTAEVEQFEPLLSYEHDDYAWIGIDQLHDYPLVPVWTELVSGLLG